MQLGPVGDGNQRTERRRHPVGEKQGLGGKDPGRLAKNPGEGFAKRARRVEPGGDLRIDHLAAVGKCREPFLQAPLARHFQKGHAEMPFEGPAHR